MYIVHDIDKDLIWCKPRHKLFRFRLNWARGMFGKLYQIRLRTDVLHLYRYTRWSTRNIIIYYTYSMRRVKSLHAHTLFVLDIVQCPINSEILSFYYYLLLWLFYLK